MSNPIADLSYRNYDGPLNPPSARWWVIARTMTQKTFKNRFYWILTTLSSWYFLVMFAVIFFSEVAAATAAEQVGDLGNAGEQVSQQIQLLRRILWKLQYLHGFSYAQLIFMFIALMVGAGAVANDNRSNALLVYLSKPVTRLDYVVGKFFGVWIPVFLAMAIPTTFFFLYGSLSYRSYGFTMYSFVYPIALGYMAMAAALHTSILLGLSSLVKQGRLAGIFFGTLYMITNIFTQMILILWLQPAMESRGSTDAIVRHPLLQHAFYGSLDGLIIGLSKAMLGTDGGNPFGTPINERILVPAPNGYAVFGVMLAICLFWLTVFWRRVRAVEVIQ